MLTTWLARNMRGTATCCALLVCHKYTVIKKSTTTLLRALTMQILL